MTNQQHPITPTPELVEHLRSKAPHGIRDAGVTRELHLITVAYRAGADQELEACYKTVEDIWDDNDVVTLDDFLQALRAARRPKSLSLAEQAHRILVENSITLDGCMRLDPDDIITIRRALKRLQELEGNG